MFRHNLIGKYIYIYINALLFELYQREKLDFLKRHNYVVSGEDRLYFERNGHLVTRGLFTEGQLNAIRPHVVRGNEKLPPPKKRFIQIGLHTRIGCSLLQLAIMLYVTRHSPKRNFLWKRLHT